MSAAAAALVDKILSHGCNLKVEDGTIRLSGPRPLAQDIMEEIRGLKPEIIGYLTGGAPESIRRECPQEWQEGVRRMTDMDPPGDWHPNTWPATVEGAHRFAALWGGTAAALGWNTLDCFGAHRWAPYARVGQAGLALSMFVGDVALLLPDKAVIRRANGSRLNHYRKPHADDVVPIWELP